MINWTPEGFIGQMFATMGRYAPPPPPGAQPPPMWGGEDHVRELFGSRVTDLSMRRETILVDGFARPVDYVELMKAKYGPTIAVYAFNADHPERVAALDRDFTAIVAGGAVRGGDAGTLLPMEYLLLTARRKGST